jgi:hypothetical protein
MNYEEVEVVNIDNTVQKHIIIDLGDGVFKSFPAYENNPEYILFLKELEEKDQ